MLIDVTTRKKLSHKSSQTVFCFFFRQKYKTFIVQNLIDTFMSPIPISEIKFEIKTYKFTKQ